MKNRIVVFILALVAIGFSNIQKLSAQHVSTDLIYRGLSDATTNGGITTYRNVFTYVMTIHATNNPGSFKENNWSLGIDTEAYGAAAVSLSKVKLSINSITKNGGIVNIDGNKSPMPLSNSTVLIIEKSKDVLENTTQVQRYEFNFDIIVDENGVSNNDFGLQLIIGIKRPNGSDVGGVPPQSTPPIPVLEPEAPINGLEVNAKQIALTLASVDDYSRGISKIVGNGLSVTYNTGYVVKVHTTNEEFNNSTIPVNLVDIKVDGPLSNGTSSGSKSLSTTATTLFRGVKTDEQSHNLDVHFSITSVNAEKLMTYSPDEYVTTLIYTLAPN